MPTLTHPSCADRLSALIAAGAARARESGHAVVVSVVEPAGEADPLDALQRWAHAAGTDAGPRMYWARPRQGLAVAAIGDVAQVTATGPGRFDAVRGVASQLLAPAVVQGLPAGRDGVGPALFGGMSFDPDGPRTTVWRDFPAARFTLPRVQLSAVGSERWVTLSMLVDASGTPDMDPADIDGLWQQLRTAGTVPPTPATTVQLDDELSADEWKRLVADAITAIGAGQFDKVVLARRRHVHARSAIEVHEVLRRLAAGYPDCFVFGVWQGESAFIGASPERLVRLDGRAVAASSLAGSAPRGASDDEDRAHAAALAASAKDLREHALVREALVSALERLGADVRAAAVPSLFTLPHVHHLHTSVTATLREGRGIVDLVEALHPTPAVGGAPRAPALAYIRAHERLDRGWYAGPVGWIGRDCGEFAVGLRSAVITGGDASLFAGCGIVATSDPAAEYAETLLKLRPMEDAITSAARERA